MYAFIFNCRLTPFNVRNTGSINANNLMKINLKHKKRKSEQIKRHAQFAYNDISQQQLDILGYEINESLLSRHQPVLKIYVCNFLGNKMCVCTTHFVYCFLSLCLLTFYLNIFKVKIVRQHQIHAL